MNSGSFKSLTREELDRLSTLSAVGRVLTTSRELKVGLEKVLDSICQALEANRGFIHLFSRTQEPFLELAIDRSCDPPGQRFAFTQTLYQECLSSKKPFVVLDAAGASTSQSAVVGRIRSVMLHPITAKDEMVGVIYLDNLLKAGQFHQSDLEMLGIIADMISVALERSLTNQALDRKSKQLEAALGEIKAANQQLADSAHETIYKLSLAAEFRDDECGEHVQRVSYYSELMALQLGLTPEKAAHFRIASQLHDVGKVGIPDSVLLKPGRYTDYEREIMKQHTSIGSRILSGSNNLIIRLAEEIALTHHEKWDGSGYPKGLAGEKIPLSGRIVAVADVFDALTTERRYKAAWTNERAFALIEKEAGAHFDPKVVQAFLAVADQVAEIRERHQPPSEVPIVLENPADDLLKTRAEGRERLEVVRQEVEKLAANQSPAPRVDALTALRQIEVLIQTWGGNLDSLRRLNNHLKRADLTPEQAPRLAELLGELERVLADDPESQKSSRRSLLVFDSDPAVRESLLIEATKRGLALAEAQTLEQAQKAVQTRLPDLVILEILEAQGEDFLDQFTKQYPQIPVVVLSSEGAFSRRLEAGRRGGRLFLQKPMSAAVVFEEIRERFGDSHDERTIRVLLLDDDKLVAKVTGRGLTNLGFEVESITDPLKLWPALTGSSPDLILLDLEMPTVSGFDLCKVLRADPRTLHLPIVVLTGHEDNETFDEALRAGADDVLSKPVDMQRLASRIRARLARNRSLFRASLRDRLTGLAETRVSYTAANHLFSLAVRNQAPFSLWVVRLDGYRQLVESEGVGRAREVVQKLAHTLEQKVRGEDLLARLGANAFVAAIYGTTSEPIESALKARLAQGDLDNLKCSTMAVSYPKDALSLAGLVEKAEEFARFDPTLGQG